MFCFSQGKGLPPESAEETFSQALLRKDLGVMVWVSSWKGLFALSLDLAFWSQREFCKDPVAPVQGISQYHLSFRMLAPKRHCFLLFHREYESIWELWGCWWVTCLVDTWDQPSSQPSSPLRNWGRVDRGEVLWMAAGMQSGNSQLGHI